MDVLIGYGSIALAIGGALLLFASSRWAEDLPVDQHSRAAPYGCVLFLLMLIGLGLAQSGAWYFFSDVGLPGAPVAALFLAAVPMYAIYLAGWHQAHVEQRRIDFQPVQEKRSDDFPRTGNK
jgi:hypothetical protein